MLAPMLPRLRVDLDFFPSPDPERPGLVLRDPFHFSEAVLVIPPPLIDCLTFFDGEQSSLDLRAHLAQVSGKLDVGDLEQHLIDTLSDAGFLNDDAFAKRKQQVEHAFAHAPARLAQHAGSGYPDEPAELTRTLNDYLGPEPAALVSSALGIAAPHVSPFGGIDAYRAAYRALSPADAQRTFVILGTSHYGAPNHFGLTRKPFVTPLGATMPALSLIGELAQTAGPAMLLEDYCHAVEHSIEFQVLFLQHLFGPEVRILPILCGSFLQSQFEGGLPDDDDAVRRVFGSLGNIAAREGSKLCWVLGVDMAHMGQRYGDRFVATANEGTMQAIEQRDQARIASINAGDAQAFWQQVQEDRDESQAELKWCGSSPLYTFLRAVPNARGQLLKYQQWNIDEESVVSFAGMRFA
jgi:MEMO1 family protein